MPIKEIYPQVKPRQRQRQSVIETLRWPVLFAGFLCLVLNLSIGGKAWSVVVVWSLWMAWAHVISPDLVSFNAISQFIKLIVNACILLILISVLLSPGWAVEVVPIVCFGGLMIVGILFFSDMQRQKQNMLPILLLIAIGLLGSIVGLCIWRDENRWALAVMGACAFALLVASAARLGGDFWRECKKQFSTK